MPKDLRSRILPLVGPLGLAGGVFVLDRLTKAWRMGELAQAWPWPGVLELTRHMNAGLIANIAVPRIPVILFTASIAAVLLRYVISYAYARKPGTLALALVLGGALGNIYDRAMYGFVFDWILLFRTSIINLADLAVMGGVAWYAILWLKRPPLDAEDENP